MCRGSLALAQSWASTWASSVGRTKGHGWSDCGRPQIGPRQAKEGIKGRENEPRNLGLEADHKFADRGESLSTMRLRISHDQSIKVV